MAEVEAVVPALRTALRLGHSYLPLAGAALHALETWAQALPPHVLQPFYPSLLPCLDVFLKSAGSSGTVTGDIKQLELSAMHVLVLMPYSHILILYNI